MLIYNLTIYYLQFNVSSGSKLFTFHSSLLTLKVFPIGGLQVGWTPHRRFGRLTALPEPSSSQDYTYQVHAHAGWVWPTL